MPTNEPLTKNDMLWRLLDMWTWRVRQDPTSQHALGGQLAAAEALWICDDREWGSVSQILLEADRRDITPPA